jgi:hypothetical protein
VVVAAVSHDCPAHLALAQEGVAHEVLICEGELDYGEHLARLWREGEGFVLVEHDVVPWPGAVRGLAECSYGWCAHAYPWDDDGLVTSLGCVKFGYQVLQRFPALPDAWAGVPWRDVDGHLLHALSRAYMVTVHEHLPPVAHARPRR